MSTSLTNQLLRAKAATAFSAS